MFEHWGGNLRQSFHTGRVVVEPAKVKKHHLVNHHTQETPYQADKDPVADASLSPAMGANCGRFIQACKHLRTIQLRAGTRFGGRTCELPLAFSSPEFLCCIHPKTT